MNQITVYKGRTNVLRVVLSYDVSDDDFVSEIRTEPTRSSELIATWTVAFESDGTDGHLLLTLDDSITGEITRSKGYMDIKRISGGEPLDVFDSLEVLFKDSITV